MIRFPILGTIRRYTGKARTLRNESRTERLLNSLPQQLRADIGWPDRRAELLRRK